MSKSSKRRARRNQGKGRGAQYSPPPVVASTQQTEDRNKRVEVNQQNSQPASPKEPEKPKESIYRRFRGWFWGGLSLFGIIIAIIAWQTGATKEGQDVTNKGIEKLLAERVNSNKTELEERFPEGFTAFGVLATARNPIIRSPIPYTFDMTWESAEITESTPSNITMQLQNVKIIRTLMTPIGTQPGGTVIINGKVIWQIDRKAKRSSINNVIAFGDYVIAGKVLSDENGVLIVAIGLQKAE